MHTAAAYLGLVIKKYQNGQSINNQSIDRSIVITQIINTTKNVKKDDTWETFWDKTILSTHTAEARQCVFFVYKILSTTTAQNM